MNAVTKVNHVLIDYENVQPDDLNLLVGGPFKVYLLLGANQTKLPLELVMPMQMLRDQAQYIVIAGNGKNALDFHITYCLGRIFALDPNDYCHIISKDTGFDSLITYLRNQKFSVARQSSIRDIPLLKPKLPDNGRNRIESVVTNLQSRGASKPRTIKTLRSTIASIFQKKLSDADVDSLVTGMQKLKLISVTSNKVTYHLPPA